MDEYTLMCDKELYIQHLVNTLGPTVIKEHLLWAVSKSKHIKPKYNSAREIPGYDKLKEFYTINDGEQMSFEVISQLMKYTVLI